MPGHWFNAGASMGKKGTETEFSYVGGMSPILSYDMTVLKVTLKCKIGPILSSLLFCLYTPCMKGPIHL